MTVRFANYFRLARCRVPAVGGAHVGSIGSGDIGLCGQPRLHDEDAS
jgi:hypothetical protein